MVRPVSRGADTLFDSLDASGAGSLRVHELSLALRRALHERMLGSPWASSEHIKNLTAKIFEPAQGVHGASLDAKAELSPPPPPGDRRWQVVQAQEHAEKAASEADDYLQSSITVRP